MGSVKKRIDYILKHNIFIQKAYKLVMGFFFRFIGLFIRTDEKLILFNAHGRKYNDSPKVIFNYILENNKYKDYKCVWALDEPEKYNIPNATKIKMDTITYFMTALKAKYWVSCVNIERGLQFKKKKTIYLNTWHGTPLKLIGNAVSSRKDFNFSSVDIFCAAGKYEKEIYKRDFNVREDNLFLTGLPRNDQLYNISKLKVEEYRKRLNIPPDKKIILYAPTWRDSFDKGKSYSLRLPLDMDYFQNELQDKYVLLLRTHSYTNKVTGINYNEFVRDVSDYPDINDLLIVSDILISDYSATIFDYSILEKPIICFGFDYDEYASERGFYIDLESELPSGVLRNQEEIMNKIKTMNYQIECKKTKLLKKKYLEVGGNATEMCVQKLLK